MRKKEFKTNRFSKTISRFLITIIITLSTLILLKSSPNLREKVYKKVFQNNMKFAKINNLYQKYFGSSLPLETNSKLALASSEKIDYEKKEKYKDGVKLTLTNNTVPLLNSGIVIFTGEKEGYGKTVIIQGADDIEIWYSNLKEIKTEMYDYLKKGDIIGETLDNKLILVFTKNGEILDYKKYI